VTKAVAAARSRCANLIFELLTEDRELVEAFIAFGEYCRALDNIGLLKRLLIKPIGRELSRPIVGQDTYLCEILRFTPNFRQRFPLVRSS
jgi:hypothetical protein